MMKKFWSMSRFGCCSLQASLRNLGGAAPGRVFGRGVAIASVLLAQTALAEPPLDPMFVVESAFRPRVCPGIYYEAPYDQIYRSPLTCPPNAAARAASQTAVSLPPGHSSGAAVLPDLPVLKPGWLTWGDSLGDVAQERGAFNGMGGAVGSLPPEVILDSFPEELPLLEIAAVRPRLGQFSLALVNNTATDVTYEVLGEVEPRRLTAGAAVVLRQLSTPATVMLLRPDGGFLNVTPLQAQENEQVQPQDNQASLLSLVLNASGEFNNIQGTLMVKEDGRVLMY